jgi:peptide deformylase
MIRPIVQLGDPILRSPAREIAPGEFSEPTLAALAADMFETLEQAGGVGLAAPQVGASVRLILAGSFPSERDPGRPVVPTSALVNPRIVWSSEATEPAWEGCLSFLQYRVRVVRHVAIAVAFQTLDGSLQRLEASGFFARVLQHEIDHLDGILTLDRALSEEDVEPSDPPPGGDVPG